MDTFESRTPFLKRKENSVQYEQLIMKDLFLYFVGEKLPKFVHSVK